MEDADHLPLVGPWWRPALRNRCAAYHDKQRVEAANVGPAWSRGLVKTVGIGPAGSRSQVKAEGTMEGGWVRPEGETPACPGCRTCLANGRSQDEGTGDGRLAPCLSLQATVQCSGCQVFELIGAFTFYFPDR